MKGILPTKDGKFVSYFESWRIPRNKGGGNLDEWSSSSSESESLKKQKNEAGLQKGFGLTHCRKRTTSINSCMLHPEDL